jgi:hypothetical protein
MKELWHGVHAYDSHLKCRFNLHAVYLWSIHDYFAYDKFAGWCVHGRLNYPICMDDTDTFRLHYPISKEAKIRGKPHKNAQ